MIEYNPKDASKCWDKGDYSAVLLTVEDGFSNNTGNPMQTWQIECYRDDGKKQVIKEYVVIPGALFKVKQLAQALGKADDFNTGQFQPEDHIGASFTAALVIEESEGYDDKNKVGRYKPLAQRAPASQQRNATPQRSHPQPTASKSPLTDAMREKLANRPAPTNPIPEDAEFKESDIPFDCAHAR